MQRAQPPNRPTLKERANAGRKHARHVALSARRGVFVAVTLPQNIRMLRNALQRTHYRNFVNGSGNPYSETSVKHLAVIIPALKGSPAYRNNTITIARAESVLRRLYKQLQKEAATINARHRNNQYLLQRQIANFERKTAALQSLRPGVETGRQSANRMARIKSMAARFARTGVTPLGRPKRK
jgi:hypothetical protein